MEQRHRVRLTTSNTFDLEQNEVRRLYTLLSLFEHRYLRVPDYDEKQLLQTLEKDFKRYLTEMQQLMEANPNNLTINRIRTFFDTHHNKLKKINQE